MKKVSGGLLIQELDSKDTEVSNLKVVTKRRPAQKEIEDLLFGWKW